MLMIGLIGIFLMSISGCGAHYRYIREVSYHWELADRSSTIDAKCDHISKFVESLEKASMAEYNAVFFPTPENSFKNNLDALKTLQRRLIEIRKMNPISFEYNQAIQQITAQEQGEAKKMMAEFDGCWTKNNYIWLWDWVGVFLGFTLVSFFVLGISLIVVACQDN